MIIRLEHDVHGTHRSSFHSFEEIGQLVRTILCGDTQAIVVTKRGVTKRFVLQEEPDAKQETAEDENS